MFKIVNFTCYVYLSTIKNFNFFLKKKKHQDQVGLIPRIMNGLTLETSITGLPWWSSG